MDLTAKMLRDVEFRDRLRGYDTDEVDEFLERVAVGIDELHAELAAARAAAAAAPPPPPASRPAIEDDDSIRRTLVLAQRTADLAIAEATSEADRLVEDARAQSEQIIREAKEMAMHLESAAEIDLSARVAKLSEERDALERDVLTVRALVEGERARLTETLGNLLGQLSGLEVSESFANFATSQPAPATPAPTPTFLEDDAVDDAAPFGSVAPDLDLDLELSLSPPTDRPITAPTPTTSSLDEPEIDEALWERWASSGEVDEKRAEDPFLFGRREE
jgi:DivIVA domain-containing protein